MLGIGQPKTRELDAPAPTRFSPSFSLGPGPLELDRLVVGSATLGALVQRGQVTLHASEQHHPPPPPADQGETHRFQLRLL